MEKYLAMAVEFALRVLGSMFWTAMVEPAERGLISACYTDLAMCNQLSRCQKPVLDFMEHLKH